MRKPAFKELGINWALVEGGPSGDFYMATTEVTFDQFDKFSNKVGYAKPFARFGRGQQPVINVSVTEALAFCNWLSKETGTIIRLPDEEEWEYAARGGNKTNRYQYSGSDNIDEVAWYADNSGNKLHPVGIKGRMNWVSSI